MELRQMLFSLSTWIEAIPLHDVGGVLYLEWTILPIAISLDDDATTQMLVLVCLTRYIVDEGIVLLHRIRVAARTLGIEEEDLTIFHADNKIYIEERLQASLVLITDGIMLSACITILIPPVDILLVCLQESLVVFLWLGCIL